MGIFQSEKKNRKRGIRVTLRKLEESKINKRWEEIKISFCEDVGSLPLGGDSNGSLCV